MTELAVDIASASSSGKAFGGVADEMDGVHQAALSAQLNTGAYGVLCQFIPALLRPVQAAACAALQEEATSLRAFSASVLKAQSEYVHTDERVASTYQGVLG